MVATGVGASAPTSSRLAIIGLGRPWAGCPRHGVYAWVLGSSFLECGGSPPLFRMQPRPPIDRLSEGYQPQKREQAPALQIVRAPMPLLYPKPRSCYFQYSSPGVAELADAADSKSAGDHSPCGFDSLLRDHPLSAPLGTLDARIAAPHK